jgi:hypothetical protein
VIQQKTSKEQAEKHDKTANQICHATIPEDNSDKQADASSGEVKQDQNQQEAEELGPCRDQSSHRVDNNTHDDGWDEPERHDIKYNLCGKVCDRMVVAVGSLADEQQSLSGEDRQTRESAEAEQGQDKEEKTQSILEALDIIRQPIEEISGKNGQQNGNSIVCEHQHRVTVEVAPCALRQDEELPSQTDSSIARLS